MCGPAPGLSRACRGRSFYLMTGIAARWPVFRMIRVCNSCIRLQLFQRQGCAEYGKDLQQLVQIHQSGIGLYFSNARLAHPKQLAKLRLRIAMLLAQASQVLAKLIGKSYRIGYRHDSFIL